MSSLAVRNASPYASKTVYLNLAERLAPRRAAVVVVDMQNDFCAPGGYIEKIGKDVSTQALIVKPMNTLIATARAAGVPVIWLTACYEEALLPPAMIAQKRRLGVDAVCCAHGTWGGDFFGVMPADGEAMFEKNNYSGFSNPAFEQHLSTKGIETLVFCGVQTNVCVESTLRDAHSRGFYVAVVSDAVASHTPVLHDGTLANVRFLLGDVVTSANVQATWAHQTALAK